MKVGPVLTAVVAAGAMVAVISAFAANASPYVTFKQARAAGGDRLHVIGTVDKDSIHQDVMKHTLSFRLTDDQKTTMEVVHTGDLPNNLSEAPKIVAIGGIEGDTFHSTELILKCPSKYDEKK
ncbi:hypothetical protein BH11ARM2_BH11ARM2_30210 [soil metagenome]